MKVIIKSISQGDKEVGIKVGDIFEVVGNSGIGWLLDIEKLNSDSSYWLMLKSECEVVDKN